MGKGLIYENFKKEVTMEWISVKDQLPEKNKEVLFVTGKNEVSIGSIMYDWLKDGFDVVWASESSIYFNDSLNQEWSTCKFWMPLPNPPEIINERKD